MTTPAADLSAALAPMFEQAASALGEFGRAIAQAYADLNDFAVLLVERVAIDRLDIPESDIDRVERRDGQWGVRLKNWRWVPIEL